MNKAELRRHLLKLRDALPEETRRELDGRIAGHLLELKEYQDAKAVLFFVSFRSEVDTYGLIRQATAEGKTVGVPRVLANTGLDLHKIRGLDELQAGYMGILEPRPDAERIRPEELDMIIIPGAAFDPAGNRIGYGGGYYDALLRNTPRRVARVALAYGIQKVDHVPAESYDQRVDMIVTEDGTVRCR